MTLRQWLLKATAILTPISDSPRLDAEILLAHSLGCSRAHLFTWPEQPLSDAQQTCSDAALARRQAGEPMAYVVGHREFWSFTLTVTPETLIPRPETELLVELALQHLPIDQPARVADLGTGSGAIAIAIALERPRTQVVATDISPAALVVGQQNAQNLGIHNVNFRCGSWCTPLQDERFDLMVSNPPYVAQDCPDLEGALRFEPRSALAAGPKGLDALWIIIAQAPQHLREGGWLVLEHGYDQGAALIAHLTALGWSAVEDHSDLAGIDRVVVARTPHF